MSNLSQYLAELEATLGNLNAATRREIIEEVATHLEDQAHHFREGGLSEEESMSKAIRSFGRAVEIGRKMGEVHPPRRGFGISAAAILVFLQGSTILVLLLAALGLGPLLPEAIVRPDHALVYLMGFILSLAYLAAGYGLWQMRWWGFALAVSLQLLELAGVINRGTMWVGFKSPSVSIDVLPPLLAIYLPIAYLRRFQVRMPWERKVSTSNSTETRFQQML
jgi:hypothetical protein